MLKHLPVLLHFVYPDARATASGRTQSFTVVNLYNVFYLDTSIYLYEVIFFFFTQKYFAGKFSFDGVITTYL